MGTNKDREAFHAKVTALGITPNVRFMGNQKDVSGFYNAADLFVFLPEFEGFGIVALEAMASGLPLIVSQGSAFPEILSEGGGIMVDPDAPEDIAGPFMRFFRTGNEDRRWGQRDARWSKKSIPGMHRLAVGIHIFGADQKIGNDLPCQRSPPPS